ncbi:MAG: hypothetical protein AB1656_08210 [Candidatus Omnitrophota bacterium]
MLKHLLPLQPIEQIQQIKEIIHSRLKRSHEKCGINDEIFPFDIDFPRAVIETLKSKNLEVYPRYILNVCTENYDKRLNGESPEGESSQEPRMPEETVDDYLNDTYRGRKDFFTKENAQIVDEGMEEEQVRRLMQCVIDHQECSPIVNIVDCRAIPMSRKPWDFEFQTEDGLRYAVEICEHGNNAFYARKLGAVLNAWRAQGIHSVFWIRRTINDIRLGPAGRDRIHELRNRGGFVLTNWSEEEWNSIAALIWMLNEADGGNFLLGYDMISMKQVEAWITQSGILKDLPIINTLLSRKVNNNIPPAPPPSYEILETIVHRLESIVEQHRIIVFDTAFDLLLREPRLDSVGRDQCLQALGKSNHIESSTMQNTQILYWIGS